MNESTINHSTAPGAGLGRTPKDVGIAYIIWLLLGTFGGHKFYLGRPGMGVAYLLTFGFLWVGVLIDLFTLPRQVRQYNMGL